jgi:hypothetical protein
VTTTVTLRDAAIRAVRRVPAGVRELALIVAVFAAYKLGRIITAGEVSQAFSNALDVVAFEKALNLPDEASLQAWVMGTPDVIVAANHYYAWVHFPLTGLVLLATWWWGRDSYTWLRRSIIGLTAFGLVLHTLMPLAPPRMLPQLGFVDTGMIFGLSVYGSSAGASLSNQYAAMPSLHVGWSLWVALAVVTVLRTRWRWLIVIHPVITAAVVVVTANHFWLDGLVAAAALAVIAPLARWPRQAAALAWRPRAVLLSSGAAHAVEGAHVPRPRPVATSEDRRPHAACGVGSSSGRERS